MMFSRITSLAILSLIGSLAIINPCKAEAQRFPSRVRDLSQNNDVKSICLEVMRYCEDGSPAPIGSDGCHDAKLCDTDEVLCPEGPVFCESGWLAPFGKDGCRDADLCYKKNCEKKTVLCEDGRAPGNGKDGCPDMNQCGYADVSITDCPQRRLFCSDGKPAPVGDNGCPDKGLCAEDGIVPVSLRH